MKWFTLTVTTVLLIGFGTFPTCKRETKRGKAAGYVGSGRNQQILLMTSSPNRLRQHKSQKVAQIALILDGCRADSLYYTSDIGELPAGDDVDECS